MRVAVLAPISLGFAILSAPAHADCTGGTETCRTVVGSIDELRGTDTTNDDAFNKISITCYHAATSDSICAGGGDFDRVKYVQGTAPCNDPKLDNDATLIQDKKHNCFYRKNFGLNGVVDARQCGVWADGLGSHVVGTTTYYDIDLIKNCLSIAANQTALGLPNVYLTVTTGGGVVVASPAQAGNGTITIPANIALTCGGSALVGDADNNDWRIKDGVGNFRLTNAIVLSDVGATISLPNANSALLGCIVEEGAGVSGGPSNPYSPSIWYPNCDPNYTDCTGPHDTGSAHLRSAIKEYNAFNPHQNADYTSGPASGSVGITVSGKNAKLSNVTILGFGKCLNATASDPVIEHVAGDCNDGGWFVDLDSPHLEDIRIRPLLNGGGYNTAWTSWDIVSFSPTTGSQLRVETRVPDPANNSFRFLDNDTVWIGTGKNGGKESARGRWAVTSHSADTTCSSGGGTCESFTLNHSILSPFTITGSIDNASAAGLAPNAISGVGLAVSPNLKFMAPGQTVSGSCIPGGTTVTAVWPLQGIVYMSAPAACPASGIAITVTDSAFQPGNKCNTVDDPNPDSEKGCVLLDASFRLGEGLHFEQVGGASILDCRVFGHLVSFHMYTGANNSRGINCATGDNIGLPDRNLASMKASEDDLKGNIVSLLIDGIHSNDPNGNGYDACDIDWSNSVLGQHRPVAMLIDSENCDTPDKLTNITTGVDDEQQNGVQFELDAGGLSLLNATGGDAREFKSDAATLNISNNNLANTDLYIENTAARASTSGCGNLFSAPTPYLCAPSAVTQPPGGRLTVCATVPCPAVIGSDVTGAGAIYYVPYLGEQVPVYNTGTGVFGLVNFGAALKLVLDTTNHAADKLYDVYVGMNSGLPQLCSAKWNNDKLTRPVDPKNVDGIWVNASDISQCWYNDSSTSGNLKCVAFECTYLGTFYTTAAGQTSVQFGPRSASGGGNNFLGLWNAYNRVKATAASVDSGPNWGCTSSCTSTNWQPLDKQNANGSGQNNRISVIDGLGVNAFNVGLNEANVNSGSTFPQIGGCIDTTGCTPINPAQTATTTRNSLQFGLSAYPQKGFHYVQAVQNAVASGGSPPPFGTGATLSLNWEY